MQPSKQPLKMPTTNYATFTTSFLPTDGAAFEKTQFAASNEAILSTICATISSTLPADSKSRNADSSTQSSTDIPAHSSTGIQSHHFTELPTVKSTFQATSAFAFYHADSSASSYSKHNAIIAIKRCAKHYTYSTT
eukprot:gene40586-49794_t